MAQAIGQDFDPGDLSGASLGPRQSLPELISGQLIEMIKSGSLSEGDLLTEARLTKQYKVEQLMQADEAFHSSLIDGADNEVFSRLYQTLIKDIRNFRRRSYDGEGIHKRSSEEHQQIVNAVRRRESALAAEATRSHISSL